GDGVADVVYTDSEPGEGFGNGATVAFGARDRSAPPAAGERGFDIGGDDIELAAVVGDVNGDGLADVLIAGEQLGVIIYGARSPPWLSLSSVRHDGRMGTVFGAVGAAPAGDVNGDGLADVMTGGGVGT